MNLLNLLNQTFPKGLGPTIRCCSILLFFPKVKFDSIPTLLSIATIENFDITQFDVKMTFLYVEIYMDQPIGFVDKTNPTIVYKLK
jgi:hypothetical protein